MKRAVMKVAMIIGLGLSCSVWAADSVKMPDPVAFAVKMEAGDTDQATAWLDAGLDPNFMGSRIGNGLMIGAWEGNIELMRIFISRGVDIDSINANGETALVLAAWKGNRAAVDWLLERGAHINAPDGQWSALHYAVFSGHKELAEDLITRGANINARSTNGSSVLMMAVYEGHDDLVRTLIEKGADRNVKNDWNEGAMEWAMRGNRLKIARMVSSPEEFNIAVAKPKENWGEPKRSLRTSKDLERLLSMRESLAQRGMSTENIDKRIALERMRIVRAELGRDAPVRAEALEITASRKAPNEQSANIVYGPDGKKQGYKVPSATFNGKPRMPPKAPVKNY